MEIIRRIARRLIGYRSPVYRFASTALGYFYALRREGLGGVKLLRALRHPQSGASEVILRSMAHAILIRPGTEDVGSLINNVFREEWGQLPRGFTPKVILDAGAYIGDTTSYFLSRFPSARVIALEPNPESHAIAHRNLVPYGDRVTLVRAALWTSIGRISFSGEQTGARISDQGQEVETLTVQDCMLLSGTEHIDLLKMDIEGAEAEVIEDGVGTWLTRVKMLLLETHSPEIERRVISVLQHAGFSVRRYRNVWYCEHGQMSRELIL